MILSQKGQPTIKLYTKQINHVVLMVDIITNAQLLCLISQKTGLSFRLPGAPGKFKVFLFHLTHFLVTSKSIQSTFSFTRHLLTACQPLPKH